MDRSASMRFYPGRVNYSVAWLLLTFLGMFGVHRMYMGKWVTGLLYMVTFGFFLGGVYLRFLDAEQPDIVHQSRTALKIPAYGSREGVS